jgi:hypothetical protein
MAEDAAYARHGYKGGAAETTVPAGLPAGATSLTGADLSTWAGVSTNGPFFFVIDPGLSTDEVCQATALSGNNITGITRGLRGTADTTHAASARIKHASTDRDFDEANKLVNAIFGIASLTLGDLLMVSGATSFSRVAIGTSRQNLQVNAAGNGLAYAASLQSLLTTKGDLIGTSGANTPVRVAVGADGAFLKADSAQAAGLAWDSTPLLKTIVDAKGDLIAASGSDTPARVAVGADGTFLKADSGQSAGLAWSSDPLLKSLVDAKGDLYAGTAADSVTRVSVGTNQQVLKADSGQAAGLGWGWPAAPIFADAAARDAAITAPNRGMLAWLQDSGSLSVYDGDSWENIYTPRTSYTPVVSGWTLSNGAIAGLWSKSGDTYRVHFKYTVGNADTVAGAGLQVSLPSGLTGLASNRQYGQGVLIDNSDSQKRHHLDLEVDAAGTTMIPLLLTGSSAAAIGGLTSTSAPVPATNDIIYGSLTLYV